MRQAGPWVGAAVVIADGLKGLVAWAFAFIITQGDPASLPIAATMAVIGHCWPIYTRFHGGMGLATGGALILILAPLTIAFAILVWGVFFIGLFQKKYSPRAVAIALLLAPVLSILFLSLDSSVKWALGLLALVLFIRHLPEWNRVE
jgi:glycerol-3-phosphate acyltransferase PlsY